MIFFMVTVFDMYHIEISQWDEKDFLSSGMLWMYYEL